MTTTFQQKVSEFFPVGTAVKAYPASNWPAAKVPPAAGSAPVGVETASGTVGSDGSISFSGLPDSADYFVTDGSGTRYVRISTFPPRQEVMTNDIFDGNGKVPWALLAGSVANVLDKAYGGVADAVKTTGSITQGQATLTLSSGGFVQADVGKVVLVGGAGANVNLGSTQGGTAVPGPFKAWIASVDGGGVASLVTAKGGSTAATATNTATATSVAYGTNLYDAVVLALATGKSVEIPAGDYIFVGVATAAIKRILGAGRATRIYVSPTFSGFTPPAGTGLTGTAYALNANASSGDLSLSFVSAPSFVDGDVAFLSSTTVWETGSSDTDAQQTTKGELVRVQQVVGSTVYVESPLVDSYTTAASASLQKVTFGSGFEFGQMRFVNATPNVYVSAAASPMTLSQYGGFGTMLTANLISGLRVHDLEFEDLSSNHLLGFNCIDFDFKALKTRGSSRQGSYGYTLSLFGCQWGQMSGCRATRSSSMFNGEGNLNSLGLQLKMPTRWVEVRDCVSHDGQHEPFLTHVTCEYVNFVNCRIYGGAFYQRETTHSSGYRIYGRHCKLINPVAENVAGTAIAIGGPSCEIHRPVIRKVVPNSLKSRAIDITGGNPAALGTLIRDVDIDGVAMDGSNSEGHGVVIANGATARIVGRNEVRNVDGYGVWDLDASRVTAIDGLEGVSHGHASYGSTPHLVKHDGGGTVMQYRNVRGTFRHASAKITDVPATVEGRIASLTKTGALTVAVGTIRYRFPYAVNVLSVAATVGTAPTGASLIVDVNKNGTTIFTTQANRPTISVSANASSDQIPDVMSFAAGDYLTVDVDQVGSTVAGSDLTVNVSYLPA